MNLPYEMSLDEFRPDLLRMLQDPRLPRPAGEQVLWNAAPGMPREQRPPQAMPPGMENMLAMGGEREFRSQFPIPDLPAAPPEPPGAWARLGQSLMALPGKLAGQAGKLGDMGVLDGPGVGQAMQRSAQALDAAPANVMNQAAKLGPAVQNTGQAMQALPSKLGEQASKVGPALAQSFGKLTGQPVLPPAPPTIPPVPTDAVPAPMPSLATSKPVGEGVGGAKPSAEPALERQQTYFPEGSNWSMPYVAKDTPLTLNPFEDMSSGMNQAALKQQYADRPSVWKTALGIGGGAHGPEQGAVLREALGMDQKMQMAEMNQQGELERARIIADAQKQAGQSGVEGNIIQTVLAITNNPDMAPEQKASMIAFIKSMPSYNRAFGGTGGAPGQVPAAAAGQALAPGATGNAPVAPAADPIQGMINANTSAVSPTEYDAAIKAAFANAVAGKGGFVPSGSFNAPGLAQVLAGNQKFKNPAAIKELARRLAAGGNVATMTPAIEKHMLDRSVELYGGTPFRDNAHPATVGNFRFVRQGDKIGYENPNISRQDNYYTDFGGVRFGDLLPTFRPSTIAQYQSELEGLAPLLEEYLLMQQNSIRQQADQLGR